MPYTHTKDKGTELTDTLVMNIYWALFNVSDILLSSLLAFSYIMIKITLQKIVIGVSHMSNYGLENSNNVFSRLHS